MSYKVVYFTRTGTSRRIAEKIAVKLSCELIEITDNMKWNGILGFIRGGFYSVTDKPIDYHLKGNVTEYDDIIAVSPMWAGKPSPTMRSFLKTKSSEKINLVVASGNSALQDRAGYKSVFDISEKAKNEDSVIDELVNQLK
jgi:menaquinone-dependent protoporphyrinogen IX oxidase